MTSYFNALIFALTPIANATARPFGYQVILTRRTQEFVGPNGWIDRRAHGLVGVSLSR